MTAGAHVYGEKPAWSPTRPRIGVLHVLLSWLLSTIALVVGTAVIPGAAVNDVRGAFAAAAVIGILNALLPPIVAALRLPLMALVGFLLVLILDAAMLLAADAITGGDLHVDDFWAALGVDDDDLYSLRVIDRIARRAKDRVESDAPGIVFLEIDGLALPVLQRAMRDGSAPNMARWLTSGTHRLVEWETDLSSQTGASQAGILLGSNDDIPAFRWVEKESGTMMTCSAPADCAEIER